ncbi:helix-turn-helix transcriptional regulator [Desulfolutivibrio sp.]|uniref:helix-turn-helix transcriptional regulator n=1 Tax=Desulfolutivibrio sp. TaxID=2773296 RepID=UPI002F96C093
MQPDHHKPERLLRLPAVLTRIPYKRSRFLALVREGVFPRPVKLGPRAVAWPESQIDVVVERIPLLHLSPLRVIATFCRECFVGPAKACTAKSCVFWPYRRGTIPDGSSRELVKVIKEYCAGCLPEENPSGCSAGGEYRGLPPCPCWPFRMGRNPYIGPEVQEKRRQHALGQLNLLGSQALFAPGLDATPPA